MSENARPHHVGVEQEIRIILIEQIRIANPRVRSRKTFAGIVENIATVGLKRPITVAEIEPGDGAFVYDLVCGQGRIEAFQALGETAIPALVVRASEADRFLMSLVENLARRKRSNVDLLTAVRILEERGYDSGQIAAKAGLDQSYIAGVLQLLKAGEERIIGAVEKGWLPISIAMEISRAGEADLQIAMADAYESGLLRGEQLLKVRRLIDSRKVLGRDYGTWARKPGQKMTAAKLAKAFQTEVRRQQITIQKSEIAEQRLLFVVTALRNMLNDDHFRTLLKAEKIGGMPKPLADRMAREVRT